MPFKWIHNLLVLLLTLLVSCSFAFAEDDEEEEEKPQTLEEGAEMLASQSDTDSDWTRQITKLNSKEEKIKEYNRILRKLIKRKKKTKSPAKNQEIIAEMKEVHERLKKVTKEFNELQPQIMYRFPARGKVVERRYLPMRVQSLEQMEEEMGLDHELTRVRKLVQRKYSTVVKEDFKVERNTAGEFTQKEADEAVTKKRIRLEK